MGSPSVVHVDDFCIGFLFVDLIFLLASSEVSLFGKELVSRPRNSSYNGTQYDKSFAKKQVSPSGENLQAVEAARALWAR